MSRITRIGLISTVVLVFVTCGTSLSKQNPSPIQKLGGLEKSLVNHGKDLLDMRGASEGRDSDAALMLMERASQGFEYAESMATFLEIRNTVRNEADRRRIWPIIDRKRKQYIGLLEVLISDINIDITRVKSPGIAGLGAEVRLNIRQIKEVFEKEVRP